MILILLSERLIIFLGADPNDSVTTESEDKESTDLSYVRRLQALFRITSPSRAVMLGN